MAGFDEKQAEAAVTVIRDAVVESSATKADLQTGLGASENRIEAAWRGDMIRMVLTVVAVMVAGFGVLAAMD